MFVSPSLAIMEVHEDFFVYKSGIYRHTDVNYHCLTLLSVASCWCSWGTY